MPEIKLPGDVRNDLLELAKGHEELASRYPAVGYVGPREKQAIINRAKAEAFRHAAGLVDQIDVHDLG